MDLGAFYFIFFKCISLGHRSVLSPPLTPPRMSAGSKERKILPKFCPPAEGLPGSGRREPPPPGNATPFIPPALPGRRGLPLSIAPLSAGARALGWVRGKAGAGRWSGALQPPPWAETHKCPPRTEQTISGLASARAIGMTNASHANCPPRVATRLWWARRHRSAWEDPERPEARPLGR